MRGTAQGVADIVQRLFSTRELVAAERRWAGRMGNQALDRIPHDERLAALPCRDSFFGRMVTSRGMASAVGKEPEKNESELLFEAHLRASGLPDFVFEMELPGTSRLPDYAVPWNDSFLLFEVKEFRGDADDFRSGSGFYDPYPPVREKINAASRKFKDLETYCCSLVLYNVDKPLIHLDWQFIYGAMLGNLGWSVPVDLPGHPAPSDKETRSVFLSGGKMHRERQGVPFAPQNQTISAILVLQQFPTGQRRFAAWVIRLEQQRGAKLEIDEIFKEVEAASGTDRDASLRELRVVVHEAPYARISLPTELFRGPYDERYGGRDGRIQRLFQGDEIAKFDEAD